MFLYVLNFDFPPPSAKVEVLTFPFNFAALEVYRFAAQVGLGRVEVSRIVFVYIVSVAVYATKVEVANFVVFAFAESE